MTDPIRSPKSPRSWSADRNPRFQTRKTPFMAATNKFDAIAIGSGVSGGWAAKELTEKGLRVLMLDRGVMVEHGEYEHESKAPYEIPFRDIMPPRLRESDYFISKHGWVSPARQKYYNND